MSSGESSKRSNLIDVTYQQLHSILSGHLDGTTPEQISEYLQPRIEQLSNISEPFGKPSDASKKKVESGHVALPDGVIIRVEDADKTFIFAVSEKFDIDEVKALILFRSFLYNEGLPPTAGEGTASSLVDELLDAITPFYCSERLFVLRTLIPLFRAIAGDIQPIHDIAAEFLPKIIPDGKAFAESLITEYVRKSQARLPSKVDGDPKQAPLWAKQNAKEQLVMLEVLFWTMWDYASRDGALIVHIYETAYGTGLGSHQQNSALLMDEEGVQLRQDTAALWILITIEVLELERVAEPGGVEISADPSDKEIYWSSPEALQRIHEIVISNSNSQFACSYVAWAFVLARIVQVCSEVKEVPPGYSNFLESLLPQSNRSYSKDREPAHILMAKTSLDPEVGLFQLMLTLLTGSPLFVTAVAWTTGSTITDPNAVAYRSVLKGLVIAIIELVPVELIPDFDSLVEVWVALFGRSESQSVAGICRQFWESDFPQGIARRALMDVARTRFPIQSRPLLKILRAMTAAGFLDTDPLSTADHGHEGEGLSADREFCAQHVFDYMNALSTFTQVIPVSACSGPHALYEKLPERYVSSTSSTGLTYANLRPIKLPGGSTLPPKSIGRLLNGDGTDTIVVAWQHQHSGWKVILEILTDYVNRRRMYSGGGGGAPYQDVSFARRENAPVQALRLEDIGVEMDREGDEGVVVDALDLIRSVVQDNPGLAEQLLYVLETGEPVVAHSMLEMQPPDLVQLTTMILEEALSRSGPRQRSPLRAALITSAMSVLAALLPLPGYSNRVWLYIRSTASLFGSERTVGVTSGVLAAERLTGHYTMTLALLHLVQQLFYEASSSVLAVLQDSARLQQVKEEVLMRAVRFVHSEIWVEHTGWKYVQLGDRFEIGRRISALYVEILRQAPPSLKDIPFAALSEAVFDSLVFKASMSAINPLVTSLSTAGSMLKTLYSSRRYGDARRLIYMLEFHLRLTRTLLNYKQQSPLSSKICLLEQVLCTSVSANAGAFSSRLSKADPVDALAAFVRDRSLGSIVPVEAMQVLYALCSSLSTSQGFSSSIIGHFSDPEATVTSLVRIILHPYDDAALRNVVWNFITLAVDKEPALANLLVTGHFRVPSSKDKDKDKQTEKEKEEGGEAGTKVVSALSVAYDMVEQWKEIWEPNPQLLASLLRFLDVVWEHGHEHKSSLEPIRQDAAFFDRLAAIVREELGPVPDYRTEGYVFVDGAQHSDLHEAVSAHAYRTTVKAHALHILALDIGMHLQAQGDARAPSKPPSYTAIHGVFTSEEHLTDYIGEAASRTYDPSLYDELVALIQAEFPALTLNQLQNREPVVQRTFGDDFAFSRALLALRLEPFGVRKEQETDAMVKKLSSINLNLSLAHAQTTLTESWQFLLLQIVPFLRGQASVRPTLLLLAASVSGDLAGERRSGDMMSTIHHARLSLLLALLEVAWFSSSDKPEEIQHFISLVKNTRGIIQNNSQPPLKSFLGQVTVPFHRVLLQIVYFCARHSRSLLKRPKVLNAEQRLSITAMLEAVLVLVIDALRITFDAAYSKMEVEIGQDMELLVAVFEQCTRLDLNPSPSFWLTRCQETDVIRASLRLFSHMDIVGFSDLGLLRARRQPLYTPHVLMFHLALASVPSAAERLASEGVLGAYSENAISPAIEAGAIDVVLPELPGERSPAHKAYCTMLAVVAGVTGALGRHGQYFDADVSALVQLFSDQIRRALSWTIGDSITSPLLEEMEVVVGLFSALAQSSGAAGGNDAVRRALDFFTSDALRLLQQVDYALTHPNHLASLFEPVTADEKARFEADSSDVLPTSTPSEVIDPLRRPFLARLILRLFRLSGSILSTLVSISKAEVVLTDEFEAWPMHAALVVPHSKVVLGEPASLGTLLELGNCALDILRHLVERPALQAMTPTTSVSDKPLDVRECVLVIRHSLEVTLLYAVTQLAMWMSKPDLNGGAHEMETDEPMTGDGHNAGGSMKGGRASQRQSLTLAERLRRGMTGELASDLQALLARAKPVLAKSDKVIGVEGTNITTVLAHFLRERIVAIS